MMRVGLRVRVTATVAIGALVLSTAIAALSYQFIRSSLLAERERTATRNARIDASVVHARLGQNTDTVDALSVVDAGSSRRPLLYTGGKWYALSADTVASADIPSALQEMVQGGQAGVQRVSTKAGPAIVVGVPISDAQYYEIVPLAETEQTLDLTLVVLCLVAGGVTVAGAGLGWYTGRLALRPLVDMSRAARGIAAGDLDARLDPMSDPDLEPLTASFNDMVDQLQVRIERDRRFAADVSHELRSPLQTLAAAAAILDRRRDQLDERTAAAAQLVVEETDRFQQLVTDLLEITRADGALDVSDVDVHALARDLCKARGIDPSIVVVGKGAESIWRADGRRLQQIMGNLLDNAECYGGGVVSVRLRQRGGRNVIEVDDAGPGVLPENRELIFRPFVRGPGSERRGDSGGAGLGLAIVARLADSLGGRATVTDRPGGGARFRVILSRRPA